MAKCKTGNVRSIFNRGLNGAAMWGGGDTARIGRTLFPETAQHCWSEGYWRGGAAFRRYSARDACQVGGATTVHAHSPSPLQISTKRPKEFTPPLTRSTGTFIEVEINCCPIYIFILCLSQQSINIYIRQQLISYDSRNKRISHIFCKELLSEIYWSIIFHCV